MWTELPLLQPFSFLDGAWESGPLQAPQPTLKYSQLCQSLGQAEGKTRIEKTQLLLFDGAGAYVCFFFFIFPFAGVPSTAVLRPRWALAVEL